MIPGRRPTTGRLTWLDLARGFAVISMVIAHTNPGGGLPVATEYLTAPWFALLIGISLLLAWEKSGGGAGAFILGNVYRGAVLIVVGEWLQGVYWQIDIVLQTLGLLTIVLAPLVVALGRRTWAWLALAVVMALLSPILMAAARDWLAGGGDAPAWLARGVQYAAAGVHYRVTTFLAIAAAGIAATPVLLAGRARGWHGLLVALRLLGAAAVAYLGGRASAIGADAYSGTSLEIVGAALFSLSATWFCAWLVDAMGEERTRAWLGAVVDTGRMALSAYAIQVLALAAIMAYMLPGQRDDNWGVMAAVIALCVGVSWVWLKVFTSGPLEWLLRMPAHLRGLKSRRA